MNYKVKLIVGFRRDQEHTIDADEAHKAYYLFNNPDTRTVFKNGLAIKGDQIQEIVPDYNASMGWNATHVLDSDDWNEIHTKGVHKKLQLILGTALEVAQSCGEKELNTPLSTLVSLDHLEAPTSKRFNGMGQIKHLLTGV